MAAPAISFVYGRPAILPRPWQRGLFKHDLNPDPDGTGLSLNISEDDNSLSVDLAIEVALYFRLPPRKAEAILAEIRSAVREWKDQARQLGISNADQQPMALAFAATL